MLLSDLRLQIGGWSWNVDLADARCRRALRDVEGEQSDRVPLGCGFDGPPDRVPARKARGERRAVAKRAVVAFEGGEHDAALVRLVAVVEQVTRHGSSLLLRQARDIGEAP